MTRHIIWMIDENERELRTNAELLNSALPRTIEVVPLIARHLKEDYSDVLDNSETVAIVLDQKLKGTGIATYSGTELAKYMRTLKSKLPIYILTNYASEAEEFSGSEWSIEDIIAKDDLGDPERTTILVARLLRHIDTYEDILDKREHRHKELVMKGLSDELSTEELRELSELQFQRSSVSLTDELSRIKQLEELLSEQTKIIDELARLRKASKS